MFDLRQRNHFKGLAFTELLIVIVTIATAVGLILPEAQMSREDNNEQAGHEAVRRMGIAFAAYEAEHGRFPRRVNQDNGFWGAIGKENHLSFSGANDEFFMGLGYKFTYIVTAKGKSDRGNANSENEFTLVATPISPGLTASKTHSIDPESIASDDAGETVVKITTETTPGSDVNRELALAAVRECGKSLILDLLLDPGSTVDSKSLKSSLRDEAEVKQAFNELDSDNDGTVTFCEILEVKDQRLETLKKCIIEQLHLGVRGEQLKELPGVSFQELKGDPAELFSFTEVRTSSLIAIENQGLANSAIGSLDAAEKAELRQALKVRDKILSAFQAKISAQSGKKIPEDSAELLHELGEILKSK